MLSLWVKLRQHRYNNCTELRKVDCYDFPHSAIFDSLILVS